MPRHHQLTLIMENVTATFGLKPQEEHGLTSDLFSSTPLWCGRYSVAAHTADRGLWKNQTDLRQERGRTLDSKKNSPEMKKARDETKNEKHQPER